jgi:hypothetical protein
MVLNIDDFGIIVLASIINTQFVKSANEYKFVSFSYRGKY